MSAKRKPRRARVKPKPTIFARFSLPQKRTVADAGIGFLVACLLLLGGLGAYKYEHREATPEPAAAGALRVVVVYESAELPKLPPDQLNCLYSLRVREYLDSHCAKGPDGKTPEFRIYDKDSDPSKDSPAMAQLFGRQRKSLPWIVVAKGNRIVAEAPLPGDTEAMLKLLRKYGGE